jgi:hypothetical protein
VKEEEEVITAGSTRSWKPPRFWKATSTALITPALNFSIEKKYITGHNDIATL